MGVFISSIKCNYDGGSHPDFYACMSYAPGALMTPCRALSSDPMLLGHYWAPCSPNLALTAPCRALSGPLQGPIRGPHTPRVPNGLALGPNATIWVAPFGTDRY